MTPEVWGLITSVSPTTGPVSLHYTAKPDRTFAPLSAEIARRAVEFYVISQRGWSDTLLLQKLGDLGSQFGVQFLELRPPGQPAHRQVVPFSTGERLG